MSAHRRPLGRPKVTAPSVPSRRVGQGLCMLILVLLLATPFTANTQAAPPDNKSKVSFADLKAVFICRLAGYFKWPDLEEDQPLRIGVLGKADLTKTLKKIAATKTVDGHKLKVVEMASLSELASVEVLFVAKDQAASISTILSSLKGSKRVLVITDTPGLASQGAIINFYTDKGKVRFELNPDNAKGRGFSVSSKLMKLARLVHNEEKAKDANAPGAKPGGGKG